ncbi:MAG: BrnA antitoxin family protein [Pacificimonas sp.]
MAKKSKAEKLDKARRKMEKAERRMQEAARELEDAEQAKAGNSRPDRDIVALEQETTITLPPELAERLKSTGKGWQQKAEAALALWLDEASLALRRDGVTGLSETMKSKAETAKAAARSGTVESNVENLMRSAMNTVGRDIAQAALGAAFAAFGNPAREKPSDPETDSGPQSPSDTAPETPPADKPRPASAKPSPRRKPTSSRRSSAKRVPAGKGKVKTP